MPQIPRSWTSRYQQSLTTKLGADISKDMAKEKMQAAKQAAEEVIMDDDQNTLIRDLIRKEMAPLRKSLNHLNSKSGEKKPSSKEPNKKFSARSKSSPKRFRIAPQAVAKDEKSRTEKTPRKKGNKGNNPNRGRSNSPKPNRK